jgi:hypothetical protein
MPARRIPLEVSLCWRVVCNGITSPFYGPTTKILIRTADDAALHHACHMVRRLQAGGGYDDPGLMVEVRNEMRERVLSIPFLAACA